MGGWVSWRLNTVKFANLNEKEVGIREVTLIVANTEDGSEVTG